MHTGGNSFFATVRIAVEIDLSCIDSAADFFFLSSEQHPWQRGLRESIRLHGITAPLWVQRVSEQKARVVDGFTRLRLARELGMTQVPVLILPARVPIQELVKWRLLSCTRLLSLAERARTVKMALAAGFSPIEFYKEIGSHIGITGAGVVPLYVRLGRYPDEVLTYISSIGASVKQALSLEQFTAEEQQALVDLMRQLSLKGFDMSLLALQLQEIALRENISLQDLLVQIAGKPGSQFAADSLTARMVRERLEARRYPLLTKIRNSLRQLQKNMEASQRIVLRWDPRLEQTLRVCFPVQEDCDVEDALQALQDRQWRQSLAEFSRIYYEGL